MGMEKLVKLRDRNVFIQKTMSKKNKWSPPDPKKEDIWACTRGIFSYPAYPSTSMVRQQHPPAGLLLFQTQGPSLERLGRPAL